MLADGSLLTGCADKVVRRFGPTGDVCEQEYRTHTDVGVFFVFAFAFFEFELFGFVGFCLFVCFRL